MSEAAVEPTAVEAEDRDLLMACALHNLLEATETTWPVHSGGPPERLVLAVQAGAQALERMRSNTPPRTHPAPMAVTASDCAAAETQSKSLPQLEAELTQAQDTFVDALKHGHKEAGDPVRVRTLADISEKVAVARQLQLSAATPDAPLVSAHENVRATPY